MDRPLDAYKAKRDFAKTPEPSPAEPSAETPERPVFVVHRHEARRLHYDLRLEIGGVLCSWAVPKGFDYDPKAKHLAVRTEDHPMEYLTFDGVIPKGEYGAGTMTIWDSGHYEVLYSATSQEAVEKGELKLILRGRKLRGQWHIVKTKGDPKSWLLFKSKDAYSGPSRDSALGIDLDRVPEAEFPGAIEPMKTGERSAAFSELGWFFEMQFAGLRVFAEKRGEEVSLRGLEAELPTIERGLRGLRAENALIDGVLVATDERGRPSAELLERVLTDDAEAELSFYAFDLLYYEEFDLRGLPLMERKAALRAIVPSPSTVLFVDHVAGNGESLLEAVAAAGLPGVIAKRGASLYEGGPSPDWLEIPCEGAPESNAEVAVSEALSRSVGSRNKTRVKLTNLGKVYWPAEGYTKGDLIAYYEAIADTILPHLAERPIHMNRYPDGIDGKSFYQRRAKEDAPDWLEVEPVPNDGELVPHMICNDRDTLLFFANQGSIDLHPWMSRRGSLESPDWMVIDFDPKGAPFTDVVRLTIALGKLLRGIGLRPLVKTSGSTGLHVYVPLIEGYTYEQSRMFGEAVARAIVREHPDISTVERHVGSREGKVYLDYLQNGMGQTVVPPYVPRPVRGATVSTPLVWDEVNLDLDASRFTIQTVPARVAEVGDLFRAVLTDRQDLMPAIEKLQEILADG